MPAFVLMVSGVLAIGFTGIFFASGMPFGAGYQPVPRKAIRRMVELSRPGGKTVYDLGSGFGRVLFEAAVRDPAGCIGVEIDPLKCWWTRREARKKGLQDRVKVVRANLLDADLSEADLVYAFLSPWLMKKLRCKVLREMKAGSVLVSYDHRFEARALYRADRGVGVDERGQGVHERGLPGPGRPYDQSKPSRLDHEPEVGHHEGGDCVQPHERRYRHRLGRELPDGPGRPSHRHVGGPPDRNTVVGGRSRVHDGHGIRCHCPAPLKHLLSRARAR